jgi:hypothetical protein
MYETGYFAQAPAANRWSTPAPVPGYSAGGGRLPDVTQISGANLGTGDGSLAYAWIDKRGSVWVGLEQGTRTVSASGPTTYRNVGRGRPSGSVSVVNTEPGRVSLYWVAENGGVMAADYCPTRLCSFFGLTWETYSIESGAGAPLGSPVTAVSPRRGDVTIFWTTQFGSIQSKERTSGRWSPGLDQGSTLLYGERTRLGGYVYPGQTLAAVSTTSGGISLFWSALSPRDGLAVQTGWIDPLFPSAGWVDAVPLASTAGGATVNPNTLVSAVNNQTDRQAAIFWEGAGGSLLADEYPGGLGQPWSGVETLDALTDPISPVP